MKKTGTFSLRRDSLPFGLLLGFIVPLIVLVLIYFFRFRQYPFGDFITTLPRENTLITFTGAWMLVANIALFTFFINTNRTRTGIGVFAVTVVWGLLTLLLKTLN